MGKRKGARARFRQSSDSTLSATSSLTSIPFSPREDDDPLRPRQAVLSAISSPPSPSPSSLSKSLVSLSPDGRLLTLHCSNVSVKALDRSVRACAARAQLLVSPTKLKTSGLNCGTLYIMKIDNVSFVVEIWKSRSVHRDAVSLLFNGPENEYLVIGEFFSTNNRVVLELLQRSPVLASRISVEMLTNDPETSTDNQYDANEIRLSSLRRELDEIYLLNDATVTISVLGSRYNYRIYVDARDLQESCEQRCVYRVSTLTQIVEVKSATVPVRSPLGMKLIADWRHVPDSLYERIGGAKHVVARVWSKLCLRLFGVNENKSVSCRGNVLLHGAPGTGKTLLAREMSVALGARLIAVNGAELISNVVGQSERALAKVFEDSTAGGPALIFLDEIDVLCPSRSSLSSSASSDTALHARLVCTLVTLLDDLSSSPVAVLAATNRPNAIDASLRRPGRFATEVELGVPNEQARAEILRVMLKSPSLRQQISDEEVEEIAHVTHGFVGADLRALSQEAVMIALDRARKAVSEHRTGGEISLSGDNGVIVLHRDFVEALNRVRPSALRQLVVEVPRVKWSDVAGQHEVKARLQEAVEWPLRHSDAFERLGIRAPCGLLLYGPPGCSKTMMARALATESSLNFICVKGPELLSKWVGHSERAVRDLFAKARQSAPAIVFFDEIDAIATSRSTSSSSSSSVGDRVLSQLLSEMDGIEARAGVVIVAATNRPTAIDAALLRPGRLDRLLYVAPPNDVARLQLFQKRIEASADELAVLVDKTDGYSGAEIVAVCRDAAVVALQQDCNATAIRASHVIESLQRFRPRLQAEMIRYYEEFARNSNLKTL